MACTRSSARRWKTRWDIGYTTSRGLEAGPSPRMMGVARAPSWSSHAVQPKMRTQKNCRQKCIEDVHQLDPCRVVDYGCAGSPGGKVHGVVLFTAGIPTPSAFPPRIMPRPTLFFGPHRSRKNGGFNGKTPVVQYTKKAPTQAAMPAPQMDVPISNSERIELCIHSNVNVDEGALDDGHAWLTLHQNGNTDGYGLWPDAGDMDNPFSGHFPIPSLM